MMIFFLCPCLALPLHWASVKREESNEIFSCSGALAAASLFFCSLSLVRRLLFWYAVKIIHDCVIRSLSRFFQTYYVEANFFLLLRPGVM